MKYWESAFYVIGAITTVWFVLWCIFVYDTPDLHPRISDEEREFINSELKENLSELFQGTFNPHCYFIYVVWEKF